jgi:RimJ/RimL family protein N-acetyltransferase
LGKWCAGERASGRFIGWFSLNYVPKTVEVEVGYRLLPHAWGRGFATEGARALVSHGFETLGLYRIIGLTHPDNAASQRVLQKAGLRDAGWGRYYDRNLRVFVAERS